MSHWKRKLLGVAIAIGALTPALGPAATQVAHASDQVQACAEAASWQFNPPLSATPTPPGGLLTATYNGNCEKAYDLSGSIGESLGESSYAVTFNYSGDCAEVAFSGSYGSYSASGVLVGGLASLAITGNGAYSTAIGTETWVMAPANGVPCVNVAGTIGTALIDGGETW